MKTIYNESLGNTELIYTAFSETDEETNEKVYGIMVKDTHAHRETILHSFTTKRDQAIDFIETLVRNIVEPDFVREIAEDTSIITQESTIHLVYGLIHFASLITM